MVSIFMIEIQSESYHTLRYSRVDEKKKEKKKRKYCIIRTKTLSLAWPGPSRFFFFFFFFLCLLVYFRSLSFVCFVCSLSDYE